MDESYLASKGSTPSKIHWVVPPQTYNRNTDLLDIAHNFMRFALTNR